ncbi:hypothetical protein CK203_048603 [Vitis vinifera]|uniref:CCHC-type domain-containing protein n=1 Tax=Vitis vinifera TaxID=29760 RepID=A0A438HKC4_VITVI|nr:hypothetical protein CK203_048603 [Vitis vinifera]
MSSDKALASTLMSKMCFMKFNGTKGVCEHIMEMRDITAQLKSLEIEMFESFLVHFILKSLPSKYEPFKISYNTHKEKWFINELLTMCVQEEGRLNQERIESVQLETQEKKPSKKGKVKQKTPLNHVNKGDIKCFFCRKKGHIKKSCPKFKAWLEKKEAPIVNEPHHENILVDLVIQHPQQENVDITLRRSTRERKLAISSNYVVHLQEYDIDIGVEDDPIMFSLAVGGSESTLWYNDMKYEMNSIANN